MFELPVLSADVDCEFFAIVLERLLFAEFTHLLCILSSVHLHKALRAARRDKWWVSETVQDNMRKDGEQVVMGKDGGG